LTNIRAVRREFADKIASADNAAKAEQLQAEASRRIQVKLDATGLGVEEYERIARAVTDDPELQADVERRVRKLQ
jgi:hypothetical protein